MTNRDRLHSALTAAFNLERNGADDAAAAGALTDVLVAFAEVVRGPAPVVGELASIEEKPNEELLLILAEMRKQTELLEVLAKQGDQALLNGDRASG